MLLSSYELIRDDPAGFVRLMVLAAIALVLAVTVHEFSHAAAATRLGDATARRSGRLSLNPLRHLDPGGTVLFFLAGFGWGKPVPVVQENLIDGRRSMALVAAAGPLSNVALAFLVAVPIKLGALFWTQPGLGRVEHVMTGGIREGLSDILGLVILFNLILAVFNLIPLSPWMAPRSSAACCPPIWQCATIDWSPWGRGPGGLDYDGLPVRTRDTLGRHRPGGPGLGCGGHGLLSPRAKLLATTWRMV